MPSSAANETAARIRSSIVSRETPSAASLPSEIGLSITDACSPSSTSASTSARTAREKPQISASSPASRMSEIARASSSDTRGKPASMRSTPAAESAVAISSFLLWREHDSDRLLAVAQRRVVEADGHARLRLERLRVEVAGPDLRAVERHARTIPSGNGDSFSAPVVGDEEVVLDAEAAAALDIASWLDCKNHAGGDLAAARLVRVRRLVRAGADAVADRVRRLAREAHRVDPGADPPVELGEARARAREVDRVRRRRP